MDILLWLTGTLVLNAQVEISNDISYNERTIDTSLVAMVSGLTSYYDDPVSYPAHYHAIILGS